MRRLAHRTHLAGFVALIATGARVPAQAGSRLAVTDDAGRRVVLAAPAQRIVSLSPAITELLFALGVGSQVVGRTTWCDYPPAALGLPSVGDGLNPNLEAVMSRRPDLVVLYRSPANTGAADRLAALGVPALLLRQDRLEDLIHDAEVLGPLVGREATGDSVAAAMARALRPMPDLGVRVAILVWDNPPTVIGGESYLDELAQLAGGRNVFHDLRTPAAVVSLETIAARDPDVLVRFADAGASRAGGLARQPAWQVIRAVHSGHIVALQGSLFSRPSPRAQMAIAGFRQLLVVGR